MFTARFQILADEVKARVLFDKSPAAIYFGDDAVAFEFDWNYQIESAVAVMRRSKLSGRPRKFRLIEKRKMQEVWCRVVEAKRANGKFFLHLAIADTNKIEPRRKSNGKK